MNNREHSIDNYRVFLVLLVVLHHAMLPYTTHKFGCAVPGPESCRFLDILVSFNDSFFMYAFFFISGLFVIRALRKYGVKEYLSRRFKRLILPFLFGLLTFNTGTALFSSYAYDRSSTTFWKRFFAVFSKYGYQLWFLWVLFLFCLIIALIYKKNYRIFDILATKKIFLNEKSFCIAFLAIVFLSQSILMILVGEGFVGLGPFTVQLYRIIAYFAIFMAGVVIGSKGIENSFIKKGGSYSEHWQIRLIVGVIIFVLFEFFTISAYMNLKNFWVLYLVGKFFQFLLTYVLTFGFLSLFIEKCNFSNKILSLFSDNGLGIYIVHYFFITAITYFTYQLYLPAALNALIVFIFSYLISWGVSNVFKTNKLN